VQDSQLLGSKLILPNNSYCDIGNRIYVCVVVPSSFVYITTNAGKAAGGFLRLGMADGGFRRADSLPDISNEDHLAPVIRGHRPCTRGSLSRSLLSLPATPADHSINELMHAPSEEEGLSLLIHGSPIRDDGTGMSEEHLLDYDSDGEHTSAAEDPLQSGNVEAHCQLVSKTPHILDMETDIPTAGTSGTTSDSSDTLSSPDVLYFQCRAARTANHRDTLVSISQDESFGKKVTVQSPTIGTLEDHENLDVTFHGSRITKGNITINQSLSMSFDPSKLNCFSCGTEHAVSRKNPLLLCSATRILYRPCAVITEIASILSE
jgi:hypothetical protein